MQSLYCACFFNYQLMINVPGLDVSENSCQRVQKYEIYNT